MIVRILDCCFPAFKDYNGRKAVHLTIEGATLLCFGQAPEAINKLLREGSVEFLPGHTGWTCPSCADLNLSVFASFRCS